MQVKLPSGVYRLYIVHAGFRIVSGDHVVEDAITYIHQGVRVERHSFVASFDFKSLKDLRIGMECDEMLACMITQHAAIWHAAIQLLDATPSEIIEASRDNNPQQSFDETVQGISFGKTLDETRAAVGAARGLSAALPADAHNVVTRGSDSEGHSVPGHAFRRFVRQPD